MAITAAGTTGQVRSQIDAQFGPINPGLLSGERGLLEAARDKLARAIAEAALSVKGDGQVQVVGVQSGPGTATGTLA